MGIPGLGKAKEVARGLADKAKEAANGSFNAAQAAVKSAPAPVVVAAKAVAPLIPGPVGQTLAVAILAAENPQSTLNAAGGVLQGTVIDPLRAGPAIIEHAGKGLTYQIADAALDFVESKTGLQNPLSGLQEVKSNFAASINPALDTLSSDINTVLGADPKSAGYKIGYVASIVIPAAPSLAKAPGVLAKAPAALSAARNVVDDVIGVAPKLLDDALAAGARFLDDTNALIGDGLSLIKSPCHQERMVKKAAKKGVKTIGDVAEAFSKENGLKSTWRSGSWVDKYFMVHDAAHQYSGHKPTILGEVLQVEFESLAERIISGRKVDRTPVVKILTDKFKFSSETELREQIFELYPNINRKLSADKIIESVADEVLDKATSYAQKSRLNYGRPKDQSEPISDLSPDLPALNPNESLPSWKKIAANILIKLDKII